MRSALIQFDEKARVSCVYVMSDTEEQQHTVEAGLERLLNGFHWGWFKRLLRPLRRGEPCC